MRTAAREFTELKIMSKLIKLEHGIICEPTKLTLIDNFMDYYFIEYREVIDKITTYILDSRKTENPRIALTITPLKDLNPRFNLECRNLKELKIMIFHNHKSAFIFHTTLKGNEVEEYFISYT